MRPKSMKQVKKAMRGANIGDIHIQRIAPKVGPSSRRVYAVVGERIAHAARGGPTRMVVRAVATRLSGLPEAWERAFGDAVSATWDR